MGSISIVHGYIKVEDIDLYDKVINSLDKDDNYPWIRPQMWNLCEEERPYFYESPIATFGATYKHLDGGVSWSEFILKFEHILRQVQFDFARIRLETEFMGDYEFFWGAKKNHATEFYANNDLIECEKWFFGFGKRHMFGGLNEEKPEQPFEFQYPIEFNKEILERFNSIVPELNEIELNSRAYFPFTGHEIFGNDHSHLILTYLKIHDIIRFGWESGKGMFVERIDEIKPIRTPKDHYS